jgi:sugar lactone lactonase YvrE
MRIEVVLKPRDGSPPVKGECPIWSSADSILWWIDIDAGHLNRLDPQTGENRVFALGEKIGCFGFRRSGGFLMALKSGIWLSGEDPAERKHVGNPEALQPNNRPNDGRCDRSGRFWYATQRDPPDPSDATGKLYRVGVDGMVTQMLDGLFVGNGIAFSPDGRTLYCSDALRGVQTIWALDLDPDSGDLSNRRVFAATFETGGRPDGACVDSDGCYWSCLIDAGQIVRFTPEGKVDRVIEMPVPWPTMCAFGGPGLDTLYVTSLRRTGALAEGWPPQPLAGAVFACRPGVTGLSEPMFAG